MSKTNPGIQKTVFTVPARSVFDLSHRHTGHCNPGEIIPVGYFTCVPGSRLRVSPSAIIKTLGTKRPILSQSRARLTAFWVPDRLYVPKYLKNATIEDTKLQVVYPVISDLLGDLGTSPALLGYSGIFNVRSRSLLQYIGLPAGYNPISSTFGGETVYRPQPFNAHRLLAYYDVFRNYFANRNEEDFPVLVNSYNVGPGGSSRTLYQAVYEFFTAQGPDRHVSESASLDQVIYRFRLDELDEYFSNLTENTDDVPVCPLRSFDSDIRDLAQYGGWWYAATGGLCLKTFMPDLNNSFVETSAFDDAVERSLVKLVEGSPGSSLSIPDLIGGKKLFDFYFQKIATGGQMDEMLRAQFGVDISELLDIPMLLKVWNFDINYNQVIGTGDQNLGDLASNASGGFSSFGENGKRIKSMTLDFSAKEHGEVHFYLTIEPYADYSQGIDPMLYKISLVDQYWTSFDRIGFQPLRTSQLQAVFSPEDYVGGVGWPINPHTSQVGVQHAWTEYMGKLNRVTGDLGDPNSNLSSWVFLRTYNTLLLARLTGGTLDLTSYINPSDYNNPFRDTSAQSAPYVFSIGFNASFKAPISHAQLNVNL